MNTTILRLFKTFLFYGLLAGISAGCQSYTAIARERVTTEQLISMSREGKKPEEIINVIYDSRTVYLLRARDVKDLLEKGVDEKVVDFMLETRLKDIERYYRSYYSWYPYPSYWGPHFGFGYTFCP